MSYDDSEVGDGFFEEEEDLSELNEEQILTGISNPFQTLGSLKDTEDDE